MSATLKPAHLRLLAAVTTHQISLLLLLALTVATFGEVLTHTFLVNWDDQVYITQNQAIRGFSLDHLKTAFSHYYVGNYAPVQIVSYMLDFTLWGDRPFGYLLANIFYHFLSGALLYLALVRLGAARWGALIGTAVFLVHPVQVESVAWLSQRKNLLAMLLYLLAFHSYLSYRSADGAIRRTWYLWSLLLFSLSLLAKSVAVIFPLMLIMFDLLVPPLRNRLKEHADKLPYLLAAGVIAVIALISQGSDYGGGREEYPPNALIALPCTMLPVLVTYLKMVLWPDPASLSIMYFPPSRSGLDLDVVLAIGVVGVLIAVAVLLYRTNRPRLFWYGLFFVGFLPVSQIVPLITLMNDRYLYFPMIGIAGLIAHVLSGVLADASAARARLLLTVSLVVVVSLAVASHVRGRVWKNSVTLFSDAVAKNPEQATVWSRLGEGHVFTGDLKRARFCYEKAASLGALDFDANYNLVQLYFDAGEFQTAYRHIWGMVLSEGQARQALLLLGEYYAYTGAPVDAERYLLTFLKDFPDSVHGLYELGKVYLAAGSAERAADYFSKTLAAGGNHPRLFFSMACAELRQGHLDQAAAALQRSFERGLIATDLHAGDACLEELRSQPRLGQLLQQHVGH